MRRDLLLIGEMIEAAEQARALVDGVDIEIEVLHTTAADVLPGFVQQLREVSNDLEAG